MEDSAYAILYGIIGALHWLCLRYPMLSLVTVFTCIIVVMFFIGCALYAAAYLVYCVQAHIYANEQVDPNRSVSGNVSICSAFLANIDEHKSVSVRIFGKNFDLPPWSVSILPDCQNVAFNTAKVKSCLGCHLLYMLLL